ncbi:MAG: hypothetical protein H7839_17415 [Magnetococcus sp. YQC-5]
MISTESQLPEPFTLEFLASELPESIASRFSQRPAGNMRFIVTIEPAQTDNQKFEALRCDIQKGIEDISAGCVIDGETVFASFHFNCS